jgi:peptidylprolyl isomerase
MMGGSDLSKKKISPKARPKGPSPEQNRKKYLISGLLTALVVVILISVSMSRGGKHVSNTNSPKPVAGASASNVVNQAATPANTGNPQNISGTGSAQSTASRNIQGMTVQDIKEGTGTTAANGDQVTVNYVGTLTDGTTFDSSIARNQPFTFTLGAGQVIKGWDLGVAGMKVGGERKLVIPPSLGYGSQGTPGGPIPPNATLNFTVDLLSVNK